MASALRAALPSSSQTAFAAGSAKLRQPRARAQIETPSAVPTVAAGFTANNKARIGVLGASGYTGTEVIRLMSLHPSMEVALITGERQAGKEFESVFPQMVTAKHLPTLVKVTDADFSKVDAVFCCLPHGTTQEIVSKLPRTMKVVDLSADFRLRDINTYAEWYGGAHRCPDIQSEAVYGLTEHYRDAIRGARLVANPGCYPTCSQTALVPLIKAGLISTEGIIIDAKSGTSGAGREAKESSLYCEVTDGMHSYGVGKHRHMPEIEQGLQDACGKPVRISFTPHLIPMSRGMQCTMYVNMAPGATVAGLREALAKAYAAEPFVKVLPAGSVPQTRHVRGSNFCLVNVFEDRLSGKAIIISVIDNLVKGASGQAMQNMNLILGLPETTSLMQLPMFP